MSEDKYTEETEIEADIQLENVDLEIEFIEITCRRDD
jgi:hypothetical protein